MFIVDILENKNGQQKKIIIVTVILKPSVGRAVWSFTCVCSLCVEGWGGGRYSTLKKYYGNGSYCAYCFIAWFFSERMSWYWSFSRLSHFPLCLPAGVYEPRRTIVAAYKAAVCGGDLTTARKSALDLIHSKLFYIQNTPKYSFTYDLKDRMIMTTQSLSSPNQWSPFQVIIYWKLHP